MNTNAKNTKRKARPALTLSLSSFLFTPQSLTKRVIKAMSFAMLSFFAPSAFSVGVATSEAELIETTLESDSAYQLNASDTEGDFTITKYLEDADGALSEKLYDVVFKKTLGDASGEAKYFKWQIDADTGNRTLLSADSSDADIAVNVDADKNLSFTTGDTFTTNTYYYNIETDVPVLDDEGNNSYDETGAIITETVYTKVAYVKEDADGTMTYYKWLVELDEEGEIISSYYVESTAEEVSSLDYDDSFSAKVSAASQAYTVDAINNSFAGINSVVDYAGDNYGGVIYNPKYVDIESITGDFIGNSLTVDPNIDLNTVDDISNYHIVKGGAIFNTGTIGAITGDFIGNYTASTTGVSEGGAIYSGYYSYDNPDYDENDPDSEKYLYIRSAISSITGDFIGNYASSDDNSPSGGAIALRGSDIGAIKGDFIGNYTLSNGFGVASGGAIYVADDAIIESITGDFIDNYAYSSGNTSNGGAIRIVSATVGAIRGDFVNNSTTSELSDARAGAISTAGSIASITGNFINNSATTSATVALGGAIYLTAGSIGNIAGDFDSNNATSTGVGTALGGALYMTTASIESIIGSFTSNIANTSGTFARGGALYMYGSSSIDYITGDFVNNSATTSGTIAEAGAIYLENTASYISSITGNFISNSATSTTTDETKSAYAAGGAIYNKGTIESIEGNFDSNYATATSASTSNTYARGGAIYNTGTIESIEGNFDDNYVSSVADSARGGAIYLISGTISLITGDFTENYATTTGTTAFGGAIFLTAGNIGDIIGAFIGNYATTSGTNAAGGAIYMTTSGSIDSITSNITGDFDSNKAISTGSGTAQGGAIYIGSGSIGNITGLFASNIATTSGTIAKGGAIYLTTGSIGDVLGSFTGNSATTTGTYVQGGAIYMGTGSIESISGDFTSNSATTSGTYAIGGAIYTEGTIAEIIGDFSKNSATSTTTDETKSAYVQGGAIYNKGTIESIEGNFDSNYATATSASTSNTYAYGGAIFNSGTISSIDGYFSYNYISSTSYFARAGAIYNNSGTINVAGDFTGNYATSESSTALGGAIYNATSSSEISVEGSFVDNYATSKSSIARGGAIYNNAGTVTLSANLGNVYSYGNWVGTSEENRSDTNGGFLYINGAGTVNFDVGDTYTMTIGEVGTTGYDSITSNNTSAIINKTGEGTLTVNSSMASYKGTLNILDGTFTYTNENAMAAAKVNVYGAIDGDILLSTSTDLNVYLTSSNTTETADYLGNGEDKEILNGTISGTNKTIDVYISDMGLVLGTTTVIYDASNTAFSLNLVDADSYSSGVSIDESNVVIIADTVVISQGEDATATTATFAKDVSEKVSLTVEGDMYTIDADKTQTVDIVYTSKANGVVLDGGTLNATEIEAGSYIEVSNSGTLNTDSDITLLADDATKSNSLINVLATSGKLSTGEIYLSSGTVSIESGKSLELDSDKVSLAEGISSTLGNADATLILSTEEVSMGKGSSLTLVNSEINNTVEFSATSSASLNLGSISASVDVDTAFSLENVALAGASIEMEGTGDLTAIKLGEGSTVVGDLSASADNADSLVLLELSDGTISLGNVTLSATLAKEYGTALTNAEGTEGLTVNLTDNASVLGNIVSNSSFSLNANNTGYSLTVSGAISSSDLSLTNSSLYLDDSSSLTASTIAIDANSTLSANASNIISDSISNAGEIALIGGTLSTSITGEGSISIASGNEITSNADYLGNDIVNDGTLNLTGGTLTSSISDSDSTTTSAVNITDNASIAANIIADTITISEGADLDVIITSENADSTILTGDISYDSSISDDTLTINVSFDDIFSVLNTTTTIYDSSYEVSDNIFVDFGDYDADHYTGITLYEDGLTIEIGESVSLIQTSDDGETSGSADFTTETTEDDDGNEVTNTVINVSGDYVLDSGEQSVDIVKTTTSTDAETGETTTSTLVVNSETTLNAGTLSEDSNLSVAGGEANIETASTGSTVALSKGTATVGTLEGSAEVAGGTAEIASVASSASVDVSSGKATVTEVADGASLSVSGGDLTFASSDEDGVTTVSTVELLNNTGESNVADSSTATSVKATSGSLTIESENANILLTGGSYEVEGNLTLTTSSTTSETTVLASGTNTVGTAENTDSADLVVNSTLKVDTESSLEVNTGLVLSDATLESGATLTINSSLSNTDDDATETTISGDSNNTEKLALGSDDDNTLALNTTIIAENIANVELNGDIEASQDTAIILSGDDTATISGSSNIKADNAIEVANTTGTVTLDNASISTEGTAITNNGSAGLNVTVTGQSTIAGNIVANSPFSLSGDNDTITDFTESLIVGDSETYGDTLTVYGSISTGDGKTDTATITGATLVLSGESASLSTYYETGTSYGDLTITSDGAFIAEDDATVIVGDTSISDSTLSADDAEISVNGDLTATDSTISLDNGSVLEVLGDAKFTGDIVLNIANGSVFTAGSVSGSIDLEVTTTAADLLGGVVATVVAGLGDKDVANDGNGTYSYESTTGNITATSLSYFQNKASDLNENALGYALDNIKAGSDDDAKVAFKLAAEANGLSSYVMSNYSQIAEVNTMLLGNQNFANVNRARSILEKSAGVQIEDEDGSISIENEDGTISVVDASEVSLIKYSNVAQLQVISLMGNKNASNGVAGYEYYSVGSTANFDEILSENALIGVSIGGTYNKVESDAGESANSTTFLLNAYAVYANEGLEVFGNVGYAHFWNEGYNAGSKADWDSDAFNALIGISYDLETSVDGLTITPLAMLNLVLQDAESASYSNGVDVNSESYFSAKLMLGFEFEYAISSQFNTIIRTMYMHEMGDDSYDFTYGVGSYLAGINYQGSSAGKDSALIGLGLSYDFSETCTAYFDYNAYVYESLITHSLNLSVALKF